jgi:hypothetical protein
MVILYTPGCYGVGSLAFILFVCRLFNDILVAEFLATDPEVPGSIPGASRFSEKQWVWNGVHSAS